MTDERLDLVTIEVLGAEMGRKSVLEGVKQRLLEPVEECRPGQQDSRFRPLQLRRRGSRRFEEILDLKIGETVRVAQDKDRRTGFGSLGTLIRGVVERRSLTRRSSTEQLLLIKIGPAWDLDHLPRPGRRSQGLGKQRQVRRGITGYQNRAAARQGVDNAPGKMPAMPSGAEVIEPRVRFGESAGRQSRACRFHFQAVAGAA